MNDKEVKNAVIAGAGPAGLTAAYEFLKRGGVHPIVMEASGEIGGISRTANYKGNRMDIGGHRFFSKNDEVMRWWNDIMPFEGDPAKTDRVMLERPRVSRIYFLRKFFDYPISMKPQTFRNMGFRRTVEAGFGYVWSSIFKRREDSLEDFYINRFGKPLYRMFFEAYTEKVWGIHPSKLGADWGSQRVRGLSVGAIIKDMLAKPFRKDKDISQKNVETSLIEQFVYPKYGPGQFWEAVADDVVKMGGEVRKDCTVVGVNVECREGSETDSGGDDMKVVSVEIRHSDGVLETVPCDYFLSSMPIKDLVEAIRGVHVPEEVARVASTLPYRDFITVGLLVKKLKIKDVKDTWIYIQERDVKAGRLQVFNNWSPYMVKDNAGTVFIGLEYFCNEGDELWNMDDGEFISMAIGEMEKIDILDPADVLDSTRIKVKKAYPAYYGSYYELDKVKAFLNRIINLFCIGRNGQHRYNNMDHSMLTAMAAVDDIEEGVTDKVNVWSVNTEKSYQETK
ncbi:MAG: NAD(P)/FAD-dependent oxidoreductase [Bacteroidales bacterium]|jgi:protoporphyrinogen oxidase|nr:NAD(P)/FAD-dependent oxidoreductase [Bacteroidales bacterium]MCI2122296.1 NAD(P)/FAD-dependent oxidoreductase [Bacteroidales bacterium]MCI2145060.1 NAD(P)/FAD-dependent oxidoreductase [Bacteroidales bacterium]